MGDHDNHLPGDDNNRQLHELGDEMLQLDRFTQSATLPCYKNLVYPPQRKLRTGFKQLPLKYINPSTAFKTGNILSGSDTTNLRTCHLKPIWQDTSPLLPFHFFSKSCVLSSDWLTLSLWYSCTDKSPPALPFIPNFKQPL